MTTGFYGINCDFGESFGIFKTGDDEGIAPHVQLANIACGFHGGDPLTIRRTVRLCKKYKLKIGAHPSLPDHTGFGRREMKIAPDDLRDNLIYQIGALKGFLDAEGATLHHVKLHGVIYSMSGRDEVLAEAVCDAVSAFNVALIGIAGSKCEAAARRRSIPFIREFYTDLGIDRTGKWIVDKTRPIDLPWLERRVKLALETGQVESEESGQVYPAEFDCLGVHLDMPNAAEVAGVVNRVQRMSGRWIEQAE